MSKLAVVIPNWNGKDMLGRCLKALEKQTLKPLVIVVDNGSMDGSAEYVRKHFPSTIVVELRYNHGFAGGVNAGIKAALNLRTHYIALLNNDAIADKSWGKELARVLDQNPGVGIVTAKMLERDKKTLDSTGELYSIWGVPFPRGRGELDEEQYDGAQHQVILAASGGASLYRASMLKEIGLFDESFFAYYEDVDISLRARLVGWEIRYQSQALVYHQIGATSSKLGDFRQYHMLKNYFFLYFKNMPGILFWKYLLSASVGFWGRVMTLAVRGNSRLIFRAFGAIFLNFPSLLWQRLKAQHNRSVRSQDIDRLLWHKPSPEQSKKVPFRWFYSSS